MGRRVAVWMLMLVTAVFNGGIRQAWIVPYTGETAGRALSTAMLCAAILAWCWLTIRWLRPATARDAWSIGGLWVALTLAFEFLAGHYVFGTPWRQLLADYDIASGRIWVLVLITTGLAPWLAARGRGLLPRHR